MNKLTATLLAAVLTVNPVVTTLAESRPVETAANEEYYIRYHSFNDDTKADSTVKIFPLDDDSGALSKGENTWTYQVLKGSDEQINRHSREIDGMKIIGWTSDSSVKGIDPRTIDNAYSLVEYWDAENVGSTFLPDYSPSLKLTGEATISLNEANKTVDLYALYGYSDCFMGYSLSLPKAYFEVEETTDHKKLIYWASTEVLKAPKFYLANTGYLRSDSRVEEVITAPDPICDGYIFLGWYDKYADSNDYKFYRQGDTAQIRPNTRCYSLDAMWAEISAKDKIVPYDGETFFTLDNALLEIAEIGDNLDDNNRSDRDKRMAFFNDEISFDRFAVSVDGSEKKDQKSVPVISRGDFTDYEVEFDPEEVGELMVGTYKYRIRPVLRNIPRDNREDENLGAVSANLTVTPAALSIEKEVTMYVDPGQTVTYRFDETNTDIKGLKSSAGDLLTYKAALSATASMVPGATVVTEMIPEDRVLSVTNNKIAGIENRTGCYAIQEHLKLTVITKGVPVDSSTGNTTNPKPDKDPSQGSDQTTDKEKPETQKPDDLNTEDHFAYIIGRDYKYAAPNETIAREEIATIFFRLLTDEARNQYWTTEQNYPDVYRNLWHNNAIATMSKTGAFQGYNDGTFKPNQAMTRAELAKVAVSFFPDGVETAANKTTFSDINGHWAQSYIQKAADLGLIQGYPDGTYKPDNYISRAEAMSIINRLLGRTPDVDGLYDEKYQITWPDNQDKCEWYYSIVQEATNSHEYTADKDYETWTYPLPVRDWAAFEQEWADANASRNPGEVVG